MKSSKKRFCVFAAALLLLCGTVPLGSACTSDNWGGGYDSTAPYKPGNMQFIVEKSAQTSFLTKAVYDAALEWNGISSKVNVSVTMATSGASNYYKVYGSNALGSEILAFTTPLGASGEAVATSVTWYGVEIHMNTNAAVFNNTAKNAQKTFLH